MGINDVLVWLKKIFLGLIPAGEGDARMPVDLPAFPVDEDDFEPFDPGEPTGDSAEPEPVFDWQAALLEEHGLGASQRRPTAPSGSGAPPLEEGEFLPGAGAGAIRGRSTAGPLARGERLWLEDYVPEAAAYEQAALRGFVPGTLPATPAVYQALLHHHYDRHKQHLLQRMAEEPLFAYARRQWRVELAAREANLEIVHAVFARLSKLIGTIYDFEPAPMGSRAVLPRTTIGMYDFTTGQMLVSERHLGGSAAELMNTIAHEQIHAFHHAMIRKLLAGERFVPELQSLALYWRQEEARRGPGAATELGTEYHAYDVGDTVGAFVRTRLV